jgi:hypothetical protein
MYCSTASGAAAAAAAPATAAVVKQDEQMQVLFSLNRVCVVALS